MTGAALGGDPNGGLVNESAKPRVLVIGFDDGDEGPWLLARLREVVATVDRVPDLTFVRSDEWDVLITDRAFIDRVEKVETKTVSRGLGSAIPRNLNVIYRARPGELLHTLDRSTGTSPRMVRWKTGKRARELRRPPGIPEHIAALAHESLEPVVISRKEHLVFLIPVQGSSSFGGYEPTIVPVEPDTYKLQPFLMTADGEVLAGRYRRSQHSEGWLLPHDVADLIPWLRAALREWHLLDLKHFPGQPGWAEEPTWQTPIEADLALQIQDFEKGVELAMANFAVERSELHGRLEAASRAADRYERALLTTQSDDLVVAVLQVLFELGFQVEDSDALAANGDHVQDIIVRDLADPEWVALVEVKGYTKGARTEAFSQFNRFSMRFVLKYQKAPNALWYVVNQFLARDPGERQQVLHGKEEDIAAFADQGGLVIDTVELFRLLMMVRRADIEPQTARAALRTGVGRFDAG